MAQMGPINLETGTVTGDYEDFEDYQAWKGTCRTADLSFVARPAGHSAERDGRRAKNDCGFRGFRGGLVPPRRFTCRMNPPSIATHSPEFGNENRGLRGLR